MADTQSNQSGITPADGAVAEVNIGKVASSGGVESDRPSREDLAASGYSLPDGWYADEQAGRKAARGPAENKAARGPAENKSAEDLESMTKAELQAEADRRGVEVEGTGANGAVTKADLVRALS